MKVKLIQHFICRVVSPIYIKPLQNWSSISATNIIIIIICRVLPSRALPFPQQAAKRLCSGLVSRLCALCNPKFSRLRSAVARESNRPLTTSQRAGNYCSQRPSMVLVIFATLDACTSRRLLNHLWHWDVHQVVIYFHDGEMRCIRSNELHLQVLGKCLCLYFIMEEGQYISLKQVEFLVQPRVSVPSIPQWSLLM